MALRPGRREQEAAAHLGGEEEAEAVARPGRETQAKAEAVAREAEGQETSPRAGEAQAEEEGLSKRKQNRRQQRTSAPGNTMVKILKKAFAEAAFRDITGRQPVRSPRLTRLREASEICYGNLFFLSASQFLGKPISPQSDSVLSIWRR